MNNISLHPYNKAEVVSIMRGMQPKASGDASGLSMKILHHVAVEVSNPLTHIFNLSLNQGIFAEALKTCRIVLIHKGGGPDLCDNYRPISLLSTVSKTLKKIVSIKLTDHLAYQKYFIKVNLDFNKVKTLSKA